MFALISPASQPKQAHACKPVEVSALGSGEGRGRQSVRTKASGDLVLQGDNSTCNVQGPPVPGPSSRLLQDTTRWRGQPLPKCQV